MRKKAKNGFSWFRRKDTQRTDIGEDDEQRGRGRNLSLSLCVCVCIDRIVLCRCEVVKSELKEKACGERESV